jgi:hypothetical protein
MSRTESLYGAGHVDALFNENPITSVPFPQAGRRKDRKDYDEDIVNEAVRGQKTVKVDPRTLHATQPSVTRAGVQHYLSGATEPYADAHKAGNKTPVVYSREGRNVLLSGTHRATAALLQGRQFDAILAEGPWGPPR